MLPRTARLCGFCAALEFVRGRVECPGGWSSEDVPVLNSAASFQDRQYTNLTTAKSITAALF